VAGVNTLLFADVDVPSGDGPMSSGGQGIDMCDDRDRTIDVHALRNSSEHCSVRGARCRERLRSRWRFSIYNR
jgi:hypothetical protein